MNAERRRFYARSGDQRSQQFRLRSHDANLVVGDLDALRQSAQMVASVAAIVESNPLTSLAGEALEHIGADDLIA
ncbi:hypothetical protein [Paracoccus sediminicola]|uniref:hypothetical protein n=1 Tax=Paracoccus sediminicola TaxID=3017783 RepID=UPI0022F11C0F|nr:hypothetical protein [Paracoccus sediminicola]WBU55819.1 hypothetical protein PAF18_09915 [Paracoccus sediminicola]